MNSRSTPTDERFRTGVTFLRNIVPEIAPSQSRPDSFLECFYEVQVTSRHVCMQVSPRRLAEFGQGGESRACEGVSFRRLDGREEFFEPARSMNPADVKSAALHVWGSRDQHRSGRVQMDADYHLRESSPDRPDLVSDSEKENLLREAVDAGFSWDARVRSVRAEYRDAVRLKYVWNDRNASVTDLSFQHQVRIEARIRIDGALFEGSATAGSASAFDYYLHEPVSEWSKKAVEAALRKSGHSTGRMPVPDALVLGPGWGGVWMHELIGHLVESDVISDGRSPFAGKIGAQVMPAGIDIADDPSVPGGRGGYAFDDEGTPAAQTSVIEDGILRAYLTDIRTSRAMKAEPTGNGRRENYRFAPMARMSNILLKPGDALEEEMIRSVQNGFYIREIGSSHVNPEDGWFVFDVIDGARIENGSLTRPAGGIRIRMEIVQMLRNVRGVGRTFELETGRGSCSKKGQKVPVSVGQPAILVEPVTVEILDL